MPCFWRRRLRSVAFDGDFAGFGDEDFAMPSLEEAATPIAQPARAVPTSDDVKVGDALPDSHGLGGFLAFSGPSSTPHSWTSWPSPCVTWNTPWEKWEARRRSRGARW